MKRFRRLPYNSDLHERAKQLRKAGNLSEALLWNQLKKGQFRNLDFDRQKIIGNYIVDFFCAKYMLVIEIDGASHNLKYEADLQRDSFLKELGIKIIHILDIDVKRDLNAVMHYLNEHEFFKDK